MIRIAYPRRKDAQGRHNPDGYERSEAWHEVQFHQIPGAPTTIDDEDPRVRNPWRKDHTADEWAWVYAGPGPLGRQAASLEDALEASLAWALLSKGE